MRIVGLTGSIGMGKSTTASLFSELGVPVYDADAAVHEIYGVGGAAVEPVETEFPGVVVEGAIDRNRLADRVLGSPDALQRLERIVHPLLKYHRDAFLAQARAKGSAVALLDVPLLFETGGDSALDAVIVVSSPPDVQRERVLARPGMTAEKFDAILARQTPDHKKRTLADFVIDTSHGLDHARQSVDAVMQHLADPTWKSHIRG